MTSFLEAHFARFMDAYKDGTLVRAQAEDFTFNLNAATNDEQVAAVYCIIDRRMRDVDIFVATTTWFSLYDGGEGGWSVFTTDPDDTAKRCDPPYLYRTMHDIEVNVFQSWRRRGVGDIDVAFWIHNAKMVGGIPCIPLQFLLDWKIEVGRRKDVDDIPLLKAHLEAAPS